jgi:uncharacterized protein YbcV (DUF1398 family)
VPSALLAVVHTRPSSSLYQVETFAGAESSMDPTVSKTIRQVWHEVHQPSGLPFPQTVAKLMELGVQRYHVDFTAQSITAYVGGEVDVAPVALEAVQGSPSWSVEKIKEALTLVQGGKISYSEFSKGIIDGGVTNYWAYLAGKRVIYLGALGDIHVEWFPGGAKP